MKRRVCALILIALMTMGLLSGCQSLDGEETALTVDDAVVNADLANFASRYVQAQYETYYAAYFGDDMWSSEAEEGYTYEDSVKESVQEMLETMLLCELHMADYDLALTEEEQAAIDKAVNQFSDNNVLENKEKVSGDSDTVNRFMTLSVIEELMEEKIYAEVDTEVPDEEAAQKSMNYVYMVGNTVDEDGNTVELTEEEMDALKQTAEDLVEATRNGEDFETQVEDLGYTMDTLSFDSESTSPNEELIAAADQLEEGEVTDVIEGESGYFVAQLVSLFDQDATDSKKESIVAERQSEHFDEMIEAWEEEAEITVYDRVWNKIDFQKLSVTYYIDESEDYLDSVETDDVAEASE